MPKDVIITPASGLVDFYDAASNLDAKIQIDDVGNLSITNSGGVLSLGNTAANVFIGDGTNSVDIIFEQNGAIRALTGKTLTLGNSASSIAVQSPITINSPILNTTTTGDFEVRQTVSSWASSTSHPIIKWSFNATYDDNLYLASGGNAAGTSQTALVISENSGILIGKASATPNATSVLSSTVATINASTGGISTLGVIISSGTGYRVATGVDAGGNLNLGRIDNVASLPYIDFNTGATTVDFDVRLQASGGNGTSGNGLLTLQGNFSVTGNLTVNGTTTTVNSTTVTIDDPIFTLGGDTAPGTDDNKDRGIEFRWHNGTASRLGFFGFDDSTGYFTFIPDATNTSEVFSGTQGDIQAANFRGALVGNATTASTWQTARTLTIGSTGKSVDGSANVSWTLAEIGAYAATNPSGYTTNTGTVTSVGGTGTVSGLTLSGTVTTSGNLTLGGTLSVAASNFSSQTANTVLAAPNGAAGVPTFRALVAADVPTLNQNTTGTAANVTGTVAVANGGTGATDAATAATNLGVSRRASFGTNPEASVIAANLRTIANPTTGLAYPGGVRFRFSSLNDDNTTPYADVIDLSTWTDSSGGGFNSLYLRKDQQTIVHKYAAAAATTWTTKTIAYTDSNITGTAANVTGTVAIANGGTGATTNTAARTNLGATTVGANLFTLTNPSAITFIRINADNTVSTLDAATFRTAIGAGTSSTTGTVTSVGGTGTVSGLTLSGTVTTSGNLTLSGTLAVTASNFASQTANTFLAAPNGAAGVPTFRTLVAADVPTLNQNTTGTASNVTGTVAIANGGTGATTNTAARTNLGATTLGANLFTITNPSAVTFPRFNADNTVSALDAATFRTAIGAGSAPNNGTLTLNVSGSGLSGSQTFTANQSTAATFTVTSNATSANTASTIVFRDASGNFTAGIVTATDFNSTSDVSLKENIKPAPGYDALSKINAVEFTWKSNGKKSYGVIAQELEQEMPELVSQDEDGIKTVSYTPLIAVLTNTVKEQQDRINRLEEIINTLLARINNL